jgi:hypothetical protein
MRLADYETKLGGTTGTVSRPICGREIFVCKSSRHCESSRSNPRVGKEIASGEYTLAMTDILWRHVCRIN